MCVMGGMAITMKCPTRLPDHSRKHGESASAVWIKVRVGPSPKCLRPWCLRCLLQGDSVLVAQAIKDFYDGQPGVAFPIILMSVEEERARQRGRREADLQAVLDDPEAADAARLAELSPSALPYHSRAVRRLLAT